jgi:predicted transcriptional regulator
MRGKRGKAMTLGEEMEGEVRKLAERMAERVVEEGEVVAELCKLCKTFRDSPDGIRKLRCLAQTSSIYLPHSGCT